jgi:phosphatidylglycerophosphatase A
VNREELKEKYGKKRVPHEWRGTDFLSTLVTTFFGSGMSPKAPGTMGSLAATIVAYPMAFLAVKTFTPLTSQSIEPYFLSFNPFFLIAAIVVFFGAIPFVNKAMKDTSTEDPGWIVIDEVCGIFMTFAFVNPQWIIGFPYIILPLGFALFRFFDILKPLGIHRFEKFPGAWGVMADDLLGGIYAGILLFMAYIAGIVGLIIAFAAFGGTPS